MYALVAFLDNETEHNIRSLWSGLSENNISKYGEEEKDRRPHITIADYNNVNKDEFAKLMDKAYVGQHKVNITLTILGTFIKSGTLFISPTICKELLDFHNAHHKKFEIVNDNPDSLYLPGKWVPHCTIASRLNDEDMIKAFRYCSDNLKIMRGEITEIALLELEYNDVGISVGASVVCSKSFK